MDRVDVDMHGMGTADGPNKDVPVDVKGFVGPLGKEMRSSTSGCRPTASRPSRR